METLLTLCIVTVTVLGLFGKESTNNCDSTNGTICCSGYMWDSLKVQCIPCKEGYTGKNCTLVCPFPSYGLNCQSACGCSDEDCNYVTGCGHHVRGVLDVTTEKPSSYNKSVNNTPNITGKWEPSVNNRSFIFSMSVVIAVLIIIFAIFLYTQLFEKRQVISKL
ncbi:multiple epidermal growth factor-like domains protein 10 [Crassostrea angulata]|uniref:multiple epidermal growth factor-like domains protein 10 n=1 Tax=Magallana angulata TaxID=2784310 RepID=UPI0022B0C6D0|nr:multiple epidermal growth factor-like domains protein 10 [Crassostrea angulata]